VRHVPTRTQGPDGAAVRPPYAVMVTAYFPFPETSGGRKRAARLATAVQRAGVTPVLLTTDPIDDDARQAAKQRGWVAERHPPSNGSAAARLHRHARRLPVAISRDLALRLRLLARDAAFVQFEEIWALPYFVSGATWDTPTVASMYNVESEARADPNAPAMPRSIAQARDRYRLAQLASVERRAVRSCDLVLAVSDADARAFDAMGATETLVVPNGIDDDLLTIAIGGDRDTVLFFGQLGYEPNVQGLEWFLDAVWPLVLRNTPGATLRIVGAYAGERLAAAIERAPRAELVGFVPSLEAELQRARVVVAPIPFGGGTRIKVLEAMAAGRPVVGTRLGVEEIGFVDGQHGFVADQPDAMARAVAQIVDDDALAARLGVAAREHARGFAWHDLTGALEDRYRAWADAGVATSRG
jgi:glycosyltransferase involved in cell wall biosynthesis